MSVKNPKIELKYGEAGVANPSRARILLPLGRNFPPDGYSDLPLEKDVS